MSHSFSRRKFLKTAGALGGAFAVPYFVPAACSGTRWRDRGERNNSRRCDRMWKSSASINGAASVARTHRGLADCYRQRMVESLQLLKTNWATYQDYRQMFDREQLDAVIVATPDHGRSLPCIRACQAGLDVYAEKPLTVYVKEGRQVVKAARKYNRVFQVGTQQRTMELESILLRLGAQRRDRKD